MPTFENIIELYRLLDSYHKGNLTLFDLLDESIQYFDSIRGLCAWLTAEAHQDFDGYCFDDLVDYYRSNL